VKRTVLALSFLGLVALGTGATAAPALAGAPPPTSVNINIVFFAYHPNDVTVAPGATITVANIDGRTFGEPHSLTGRFFNTGVFTTGIRTITAPTTPGNYYYLCLVHGPSMYGVIRVGED
jgi:plastocyanin